MVMTTQQLIEKIQNGEVTTRFEFNDGGTFSINFCFTEGDKKCEISALGLFSGEGKEIFYKEIKGE